MSARSRKQKVTETEKSEGSPSIKSVTIERSRVSTSTTPQRSFSRSERSHSPLNISRSEEKEELAHLNSRLASYIDHVRKLELENQRLSKRIQSVTEERISKVDESRKTYEQEISALRTLVDDLAKQKSKAEVESKQAVDDCNEAKAKINKRDQEVRALQRKVDNLEKDLAKYKQDFEAYQPLLRDYQALEKKYEQVKRDLEAETLLRTDLENKVLGLKEQLDFRNRLFDEEREKLVQKSYYIEEEVAGRKQAEFESKLADELQAIREQTAIELEEYKLQMEETFETKLGQLKSADIRTEDISRQQSELMVARKRVDDLSYDLAKKVAELELLQRRVEDLERQLRDERTDHGAQLDFQRQEINRLKDELENNFREFTELMNTKIALDQEILMYRKMLEGEESRLNIHPRAKESPFAVQFGKRRRVDDDFGSGESSTGLSGLSLTRSRFAYRVSCTATGAAEFFKEQDTEGKWVKITNNSADEIQLGNWELVHEAGGHETRYKFQRTFVLKPGTVSTIWSHNANATHDPPSDLVMKKNFSSGPAASMTLVDNDGTEQAKCTVKRERVKAIGPSSIRRTGVHARDEKCHLM